MGFKTEVTKDNIDKVETDTLIFVDKAISSLGAAMAGLKAGEGKTAGIFETCHALQRWKEGFLARDKDEPFEARVTRLRELADVCCAYR